MKIKIDHREFMQIKRRTQTAIASIKIIFISLITLCVLFNCSQEGNNSRLTDIGNFLLTRNIVNTCEEDPGLCTLSEFSAAPASEANTWTGLQYANQQFVAVSSNGTNQVMRSTDGKSWTPHSASAVGQWLSIAYGNGIWVAVSSAGQRLMCSNDGINWTNLTVTSETYTWVEFANGKFITISTGVTWATSTDGINWTSINSPSEQEWTSLAYGNGIWVAVSRYWINSIAISTDGINWGLLHTPNLDEWLSITFGKGTFVAIARNGMYRQIVTSWDGIDWGHYAFETSDDWSEVHYANGLFMAAAISGPGSRIASSTDGITWTSRTPTASNPYKAIGFGNDTWVVLGSSGPLGSRVQWATWKKN